MQEYKPRVTSSLISGLGAVIMLAGIVAIVFGIIELVDPGPNNIPGITLIIAGIGAIISASLMYIVANLSEDVHKLSFDFECLAKANTKYQRNMVEHLQEVDRDHDAIKKGISVISGKLQ